MDGIDILLHRLHAQRLTAVKFDLPSRVVSWMGAMQAQEYTSVKWAVGLRCHGATEASIEQAIASKAILRTWLLRGTLHFVAPSDIRWMLMLVAPRLITANSRRNRELELDEITYSRSFEILTRALQGGHVMRRDALLSTLEQAGISPHGQRGYHILARAALEGLICFGPVEGKQQTFVLLDKWVPQGKRLTTDEALAELARRYFTSHGPATLQDFTWWSGLAAGEARLGLEMVKTELQLEKSEDQSMWMREKGPIIKGRSPSVFLLPGFDEYYLGYTDRSLLLETQYERKAVSSNGVFRPMIVLNGQVVGTWKREVKKGAVIIIPEPFGVLAKAERQALTAAVLPYGTFLGLPVELA